MSDRERNGQGRFEPEVTDEEILESVREHEPAGTSEIGESVGLARQNADYRLRQLQKEGLVSSKKVGGSLVWMFTEDSNE